MTLDAEQTDGASPEPSDPDAAGAATPASGGDVTAPDDALPSSGRSPRRRAGGSSGLLGAAMLAVGEILEPEKTRVEIVQTDDEPLDELPFGIDFGDLPPLD